MTVAPRAPRQPSQGGRVIVNTASLASASLWRIGIAFVIQVAIARKLGASALGDYGIVLAWLYVGQITLEAGLPAYFVRQLAGHKEWRRIAHSQILRIEVLLAVIVWMALVAGAWLVPALRSRVDLFAIAGASLPFYAILSSAGTIFEASERMDRVFLVDGVTNAALLAATLVMLFLGGGVAAALLALTLTQVLSALLATAVLWRSRLLPGPADRSGAPDLPGEIDAAEDQSPVLPWRRTLRAARPFFYISLADVLQQRADLLLLSAVAPPQVTGVYVAANSLVRVLIKVTQAYWRALYPTLSRLHDMQTAAYRTLGDMAQRFVLAVTLPAATIGGVAAAGVVTLIFGAGYENSVPVLALLLPTAPFYAWEVRCVTVLLAEHRPRTGLRIAIAHLVIMVVLLPPLAWSFGATGAALAATLAAAVGAAAATWLARDSAAAPPNRRIAAMVLSALVSAGAAILMQCAGLAWWSAALLAALLYAVLLGVTGAMTREDVRRLRNTLAP